VEVFRQVEGTMEKLTEMGPAATSARWRSLLNQPRNATIRAITRVEVYTVDRATFDKYRSR